MSIETSRKPVEPGELNPRNRAEPAVAASSALPGRLPTGTVDVDLILASQRPAPRELNLEDAVKTIRAIASERYALRPSNPEIFGLN